MKKIMVIFGTRPDAIKMLPLALELKKYKEFDVKICVTAQHREMLDQVLEIFDVKPDYDLNIMTKNQTLEDISGKILIELKNVLINDPQDLVLVHGDTTTGLMSALEAFYQKIPVGHVEAGLRSFDIYSPFPEEMNRKLIGAISTYHFAPTENNVKNLLNEGIKRNSIVKTGNTVIDVLKYTVKDDFKFKEDASATIIDTLRQKEENHGKIPKDILNNIDYKNNRIILLTAHRRENLGTPLENICRAIKFIVKKYKDVEVIYPVHLNPKVRETVNKILGNEKKVHLIEPLDVKELHNLMKRVYLVATDSGGIQEEAPALGKPVLVLRTETERPEAVEAGTVKLIGIDEENIKTQICLLLDNLDEYNKMSKAVNPYGDGNASKYIAEFLLKNL